MDEMVDIIKRYSDNKLSEIVVGRIAEYIATGKDNEVFKSLPNKYSTSYSVNYYVEEYLDKIKRNMTPEMLPRFYNMIKLLQHMKGAARSFVHTLGNKGMIGTFIDCYNDERELYQTVATLFDEVNMRSTDGKTFEHVFETFYKKDPAMLEKLLAEISTPFNYLLRFYMLHKDYNRYKHIEAALIDDAKAVTEKIAASPDNTKGSSSWMMGSFVAYGKPGAVSDVIKNAYPKAPETFVKCMLMWNFNIIRDKMIEVGLDLAPFIAYYAKQNKSTHKWLVNQCGEIIGSHYEDAQRAIPLTDEHGKGVLYLYLNESGQKVDIAGWEKVLLNITNTTESGKQWLAKGGEDPKWLKERTNSTDIINPKGIVQSFAGSMLGQSDIAARYTQMLLFRDDRKLDVQEIFDFFNKKYADEIIEKLDNEKLIDALSAIRKYYSAESKPWDGVMSAIAKKDPKLYKEKMLSAKENESRVYMAMCLPKDFDIDFFIDLLGDKSKKIGNIAYAVLAEKPELKEKIKPLAEAKKKAVRDYAEKLLMHYDGGESSKEMGAKEIEAYFKKYGKNIEKALEWTNPAGWPKVKTAEPAGSKAEPAGSKADGKDIDENTLKYYVYQFLNSKTMEMPPHTQGIAKTLNKLDLHALAADIYSQWTSAGAEAKKKGALLLFGVNADNSDVVTLRKQIDDWADNSRGAIAADAVKAMALSGQDLALMQVDSIANKFKNKQVRKAATESFALAADAMGLTADQLADRIIPDLGFDQRGEKEIDFGTRKFTAFLTPALAVELKDENGKKIKSLPKPGAKDDEVKANAAKAEFTALKKSLKTVVTTQEGRLENALSSGRTWEIDAWEKLFVQNPIMHSFAMGLIWGFYKDSKLVTTFRYMDDGSLTDINDDSLSFADYKGHTVGLIHPLELTEEQIEAWKEQLDDFEIVQPVLQLRRPMYLRSKDEENTNILKRFGGIKLPGITLINKLMKMGWSKGSVQDGGAFYSTYKEFPELGIGVQLNHTYLYVVLDYAEEAMMGEVVFYNAGTVERGSYVYDEPKDFIPLKDVPANLFSEVCYNLDEASKTSTFKDEHWQTNRDLSFF